MPIVSTGEITIIDVMDGVDGPALSIQASKAGFAFQDGVAVPTTQAIAFTAARQSVEGDVAWSASNGMTFETDDGVLDVTSFAFGIPGAGQGDTAYLDLADFGVLRQGSVVASVGGLTAFYNVLRIDKSTAQANATRNVFVGNWTSGTSYFVGDVVLKDGYGWSCLVDHVASGSVLPPTYPTTGNTFWTAHTIKGDTGATGITGTRGTITTSRAISGTAWSDAEAASAITAAGGASLLQGDVVTLYNSGSAYSETRIRSSGGTWSPLTAFFGGNVLVDGTLGASKIIAGAISTDKLAANAVTALKIAANTITAGQIAANTLTAGQIAAGAIGAGQIAAGAITVQKLLVAPVSLCPDPFFEDNAWWGGQRYDSGGWYFEGGAVLGAKRRVSLYSAHPTNVPGTDRKHLWSSGLVPPAAGTTVRMRCRALNASNQVCRLVLRFTSSAEADIGDVTIELPVSMASPADFTVQAGVPADAALMRFIIYNEGGSTFGGACSVTGVMVDVAASADLIVDGAITATKVAAGAITTSKLAAGAVTANEIAANAVTAAKIAANTITATQIAAGTITATEIAANTITAGKIAAAAIGAGQIAAGAITADKLFVTGRGDALNDDPNTQDLSAWSGSGLSIIDDSTSPAGRKALRCSGAGATVLSRTMPLDAAKNYQLRLWTRQESGASTSYLTVAFFDTSGAVISGGASGWLNQGTYHYFGLTNGALPASWTEYRISFGPGEAATIPSGARFVAVGVLSNYTGSGTQLVASIRLMLKADADLIVDGAISAVKITAGAITTAKIAAGAVTANEIAAGTITAGKIAAAAITASEVAAGAITTAKIAAGAVTANELSANSVVAGKIATAAVNAAQIAAGAITTDKLLVTGRGAALNEDPGCQDPTAWQNGGHGDTASQVSISDGIAGSYAFRSTTGTGSSIDTAKLYPVSSGKRYRLSVWVRRSSTANGVLYLRLVDQVGNQLTQFYEAATPTTSWVRLASEFVPTAAQTSVRIRLILNWTGTAGYHEASDIRLEEKAEGDLIVDGTIAAAKIAAGTLTVDKMATGLLSSDNVLTRGLTVRDASGNVLFGVGTNLDWGRIANQPSGIYNSNITTSGGAIQGIGSGAGTAVANANISLGANGALRGSPQKTENKAR